MNLFNFDEEIDRTIVPALKMHPIVLGKNNEHLFAAGVADMDFKVSPVIVNALHKRLEHEIFGYETLPDDLIPSLTKWLHDRHNWSVQKHHILRAPNVLNALALATSLFTKEDDGVIVQPPVFFDFFDIIRENNRKVISNPLVLTNGHYQMNFDDLEQKASNPNTKMLYLCNPHNPVGRVWNKKELQTLGDICERHNVLIVSDEIHGDLVFSNQQYVPFASLGKKYANNCITSLSPAKSFNIASCCCAFTIISNDDKRKIFQAENSKLTVNKNNAFANVAMEAAYKNGKQWLKEVLLYIEKNLDLVREELKDNPSVALIEPEGTFLLWLDFRRLKLSPEELTIFLKTKAKWAVSRGHVFGSEGVGFARLNIACRRTKLKNALEQLKNALGTL